MTYIQCEAHISVKLIPTRCSVRRFIVGRVRVLITPPASRASRTVVITLGSRSVDSTCVLMLRLMTLWYRLKEEMAERSLASTMRARTCTGWLVSTHASQAEVHLPYPRGARGRESGSGWEWLRLGVWCVGMRRAGVVFYCFIGTHDT